MFAGNPCFSSSGREDPQPNTNPFQLWLAVKRALCTFYAKLRGEAESKTAPLERGPKTLIENSWGWGGWGGTTC